MKKEKNIVSASNFKKHCLSMVDEVKNKHHSFIITKRNIPVAKIVPLDHPADEKQSHYGTMKGFIKIKDDIINFSSESDWDTSND